MKTIFGVIALASAMATALVDLSRPAIDMDLINKINSDPKSTWKAGVNERFLGMTLLDAKKLMGARMDKDAIEFHKRLPVWNGTEVKDLPTSFSVLENWPKCAAVTGFIRDQANCGSCWAVSSASAVNDRICIAQDGGFTTLLSTQDITSCCTGVKCFGSQGCDGGMPGEAWQFAQTYGVVTGGPYAAQPNATDGCEPYELPRCSHHVVTPGMQNCTGDASTPSCATSCPNKAYTTPFAQDKHKIQSTYSLPSVTQMQQSIMEKGTITVAFEVYENFLTYKSGVYTQATGSVLGGHAVDIVGWGEESNTPYWVVRNSWNEHWGDNGYIKFLRGQDLCGIESQAVAGDA